MNWWHLGKSRQACALSFVPGLIYDRLGCITAMLLGDLDAGSGWSRQTSSIFSISESLWKTISGGHRWWLELFGIIRIRVLVSNGSSKTSRKLCFKLCPSPFWVIHLLFHCFMVFPFQVSSVPSNQERCWQIAACCCRLCGHQTGLSSSARWEA